LDEFRVGERVEVVRSGGGYTAGQKGTISRVEYGLIMVELDEQPILPGAVTIIDASGEDAKIESAFQPHELRHVVTPSKTPKVAAPFRGAEELRAGRKDSF
jgi:hypothetical protein